MEQDGAVAAVKDVVDVVLGDLGFALKHNLMALQRHHLTRILISEILIPALQHTGSERSANALLQVLLVHLHFLCEVENLQDVLVALEAYGAEHGRHGQLLLTVDVGIHHVVDVGGEFNPRTLEGDDAGTVENSSVGVNALAKEHAGGTVQLGNDDTLSAIDDKRAVVGHIGNGAQEDILRLGGEILVVLVCARQSHLGPQRNTIGQPTLQALVNGVARGINEVVQELKNEIVAGIGDGEVLGEHLIQTVILAFLRRCVQL